VTSREDWTLPTSDIRKEHHTKLAHDSVEDAIYNNRIGREVASAGQRSTCAPVAVRCPPAGSGYSALDAQPDRCREDGHDCLLRRVFVPMIRMGAVPRLNPGAIANDVR
jgi:hypothetical protein